MMPLADKGNGHYAYVDNLLEAKKVFVHELGATLYTIAKDVKIQVEFNPERVAAYRLIGYEKRILEDADFNDDTKDAGELGAGHSVTALYEIVPAGIASEVHPGSVDPLKYQRSTRTAVGSRDWLTVKLRYKAPTGTKSKLLERVVQSETASPSTNFVFASAVAGTGMLLRGSEHKGDLTFDRVLDLARKSKGADPEGYRAEFIRLVELMEAIAK
jgi:Ca-activated chloride channel family protein